MSKYSNQDLLSYLENTEVQNISFSDITHPAHLGLFMIDSKTLLAKINI